MTTASCSYPQAFSNQTPVFDNSVVKARRGGKRKKKKSYGKRY